jgi:hypothetical protein
MNIHPWKRAVALGAIAAFLATGCASLQNVPLQHADRSIAKPDVKVGESVVVTKNDGSKQKFTVTGVDDDALIGHSVRVPYADMTSLDVARSDGRHSNKGLIIGAVVLGAIAIAAAASGGGGGSGGY